jgi:hypothetical protein
MDFQRVRKRIARRESVRAALARRWDMQVLAVLGDRSPCELIALLRELIHERVVAERVFLVLVVDQILEL